VGDVRALISREDCALAWRIAKGVFRECFQPAETAPVSRQELYHYGIAGLLEARKRFDRSKNVPWPAFAAYRVRGAMLDEIRRLPVVRLPQALQQKVKRLKEVRRERAANGKPADPQTLADELDWDVEEVHRVVNLSPNMIRSDQEERESEGEKVGPRVTLSSSAPDPEQMTLKRELSLSIRKCLDSLATAEERLVVVGRVLHGLKLRELAESLGCSIEKVRLIQERGQAELRTCMENQGWSMEDLA
jgi:RNA polymerase sigma factor for flagellar operon FliA